jgi:hypothetical protein
MQIPCLKKGQVWFNKKETIKKNTHSKKMFSENVWVFDWQHICYVWWTCLSTESRHSCTHLLWPSSRQRVPLFVLNRLHTYASEEKQLVPFVVSTIRSFLYSRFIIGFATRVKRRVPYMEQELLTLKEHMSSPPVLVGFVFLDL